MVFASHIPQVANLPTGVANLLAPMGYHGVAIFLFLSGYGCYISLEKNRNIVKFVKKRARAILPSLIVVTVIAAIVNYIVNGISYSPLELILNSLGLSHGILQLTWYIEFQYFCYMASCVISKCIKCEHRAISFVALAIAIYILSVTVHGANLWGLNYASYSIGMWAALYRKKILKFINMCSGYKMLRIFAECLFLWMGLFGTTYFFLHNPTELVLRNILKGTISSAFVFALCSLVAGLTASGADAYLLHVTTTPSVAYIARVDDFDCGIMISASHNPYYDNGIKLIDCYGEKMPEEILLLVEDYIDGKLHVFDKDWPELPFAHREHIGCTVDYVSGRNRYMGYLISLGIYSFKGVKVGLDCANGSSWNIAKSVFDALGADTYVINNKPNGLNINNNAGSTHIEGLQKFVVENGLDVGFAFDGDADRCLCVDEKGNVVTGDHILYIYGCYMQEHGELTNNTVVTTVMSNFGLYKAFDEQGIGYAKTAVGDKYVYEYMAKNGCRIGGEQSGHIIFSKYASTGDGILTSLKMMEVMLAKKMPMSKLAEPLKIYPQVLENVRVTDKKAAQNDPAVQEAVKAVAEALGDTGRILVRESGTEPLVRVMVEAPDHDTCQKYVSQVVEVIKSRGYTV